MPSIRDGPLCAYRVELPTSRVSLRLHYSYRTPMCACETVNAQGWVEDTCEMTRYDEFKDQGVHCIGYW